MIQIGSAWSFWARENQTPPTGDDWTTWLILGGRGAGKTRAGAEWIAAKVRQGAERIALVGETYEDVREVMIEGQSGLRNIGQADFRPTYVSSRHLLEWPNGAQAMAFSADDPDGLRGHQFDAAWSDELAKWKYADDAWSNLQLGLRLGPRPQQVVTTTPRPLPLLRQLIEQDSTRTSRTSTFDNVGHLAPSFLDEVTRSYGATRLGRQELYGEIVDDVPGALWSWALLEACRVSRAPDLARIVVAVDPPVTHGPDADECGIIVAGITPGENAPHAYVLSDASVSGLSPRGWAERVTATAEAFGADRIVAEVNQGGDLVKEMIHLTDPNAPVKMVRATRGKIARAEPTSAFYEQGRVHHVGAFPELEDQLTTYAGTGHQSPDRLDALVWALTELMSPASVTHPSMHIL
ncbi:MAG: DNA-packaging protein [Parvularcula sp.]